MQDAHDLERGPRCEGIVDRLRAAFGAHDARCAQHAEMLRQRGLAQRPLGVEFADRSRTREQRAQQLQTLLIRERLQESRRFGGMAADVGDRGLVFASVFHQ
jgi:hypothetical protein